MLEVCVCVCESEKEKVASSRMYFPYRVDEICMCVYVSVKDRKWPRIVYISLIASIRYVCVRERQRRWPRIVHISLLDTKINVLPVGTCHTESVCVRAREREIWWPLIVYFPSRH